MLVLLFMFITLDMNSTTVKRSYSINFIILLSVFVSEVYVLWPGGAAVCRRSRRPQPRPLSTHRAPFPYFFASAARPVIASTNGHTAS